MAVIAPCRVTLGLPLIGASGGGGGRRARVGGLGRPKRLMVMPGTTSEEANCAEWMKSCLLGQRSGDNRSRQSQFWIYYRSYSLSVARYSSLESTRMGKVIVARTNTLISYIRPLTFTFLLVRHHTKSYPGPS